MTTKIIQAFVIITLMLAFVLSSIVSLWLIYPYNVLEINSYEMATGRSGIDKVYCKGESISINITYTKNMSANAHIYSSLVDGIIIAYAEDSTNLPVGAMKKTTVSRKVPEFVTNGEYYLDFTIMYDVNPVRDIEYKLQTPKFAVIECL